MSNSPKELRKALRNVVQEQLPDLIKKEIFLEMYTTLHKDMVDKMTKIEQQVRESLGAMDSRSKDVQDYIMRTVMAHTANTPTAAPSIKENNAK